MAPLTARVDRRVPLGVGNLVCMRIGHPAGLLIAAEVGADLASQALEVTQR